MAQPAHAYTHTYCWRFLRLVHHAGSVLTSHAVKYERNQANDQQLLIEEQQPTKDSSRGRRTATAEWGEVPAQHGGF